MTDALREAATAALSGIVPSGTNRSLVDLGFVEGIELGADGTLKLKLVLRAPHSRHRSKIEAACREALSALEGVRAVEVESEDAAPPKAEPESFGTELLDGVKNIVAVASGKGGVGKSTVSANLACALALDGRRVGLLDADIHGPSMNLMFGVDRAPEVFEDKTIAPVEVAGGIRLVSMAMFSDPNEATIWRGPMASQMVRNFLFRVRWGELDDLVVDLPPGTGDIHLSLVQSCPMTGAVVVTTPQEVAAIDARKGLRLFEKVSVPVLGVVENMSGFVCDGCGKVHDVFGTGAGMRIAQAAGVPFLGKVPLEIALGRAGDAGRPAVLSSPNSPSSRALMEIARKVAAQAVLVRGAGAGMGAYDLAFDAIPEAAGAAPLSPAEAGASPVPAKISRTADALVFDWTDGARTVHPFRELRLRCPCARCVDEWDGHALLDPASVPADVWPERATGVGRYAVRLLWSDGHGTGIYGYDYLRRLGS